MDYYEALFSAVFNILSLYVNIRVINLFLPKKITKMVIVMPVYFAVWISNWLIYYIIRVPYITTISLFLGLMIAVCILFEGDLWKKIVAVVVSVSLIVISEDIVWKILHTGLFTVENDAVGSLCSVLIALGIILALERHMFFDRYAQIPRSNYWGLIFMSCASIILAELLVDAGLPNKYSMLGLSVICLLNVSIYFLYEKISESYKERMEKVVMEQQIKMYIHQFEIIKQTQQNIKSLRHDLKNHLLLLNTYLQNEKYNEAKSYIEQMEKVVETSNEYVKTGNIEIDSLLNYKLKIVEEIGCIPILEIDVPNESFMSDFDFTILIGNLLDNAIEALQKVEEKYLCIKLILNRGILYINISNSFDGKLYQKGKKFLSIKKDKEQHGIGLSNIEKIVNKYEGTMKISKSNNIYITNIILYIRTAQI